MNSCRAIVSSTTSKIQLMTGLNSWRGAKPLAIQAVHSPLATISEMTEMAPSRHATGIMVASQLGNVVIE